MSQTKAQLIDNLVQALNFTGTASAPANGAFLSATNTLALATNSAQRLTIDSSGRLLLGTTTEGFSEGDDLTINSADHGGITIRTPTNKEGNIAFSDTTSGTGEYSGLIRYRHLNDDLGLWTASNLRLLINSSGNVGIGESASIDARLHINSGTDNATLFIESTDGDVNLCMADNAGSCRLLQSAGDLHFRTGGNANAFGTGDSERMVIDSSGNVGIGTTSPDTRLHVHKASAGSASSDNNSVLTLENNNHCILQMLSPAANSNRIMFGDPDATNSGEINYDHNINSLLIKTNGSEQIRVDSSGNVGIGTTSPFRVFEINNSQPCIRLTNGTNAYDIGTGGFVDGSDSLCIHDQGQGERLRIDSSGRLLIGTTTNTFTSVGSSRLQVSGTGADTAGINLIRTSNDGGGAYLQFTKNRGSATQSGDTCGGISWMGHDGTDVESYLAQIRVLAGATATSNAMTGDILFETANSSSVTSERMRIDSSGRVGIGDTSPDGALVVKGTASVPHTVFKVNSQSESTKFSVQTVQDSDIRIGTQSNHPLALYTNQLERMRILSSGNVAIGSTTASSPLHVFGIDTTIGLHTYPQLTLQTASTDGAADKGSGIMFLNHDGGSGKFGGNIRVLNENSTSGNHASFMAFSTRPTGGSVSERMRINSSGRVLIKCEDFTNDPGTSNRGVMIGDTSSGSIFSSGSATGTQTHLIFRNGNGDVGLVQTSGSSTSYNTQSDYRLKENAVAISDGITRLKTLKPYRFNFKTDPSTTVDGFFAHEVTAVPEAISGTKDEVALADDKDKNLKRGDPIYQGIDQSKLVPLLVAAVKELITKVETLEAA